MKYTARESSGLLCARYEQSSCASITWVFALLMSAPEKSTVTAVVAAVVTAAAASVAVCGAGIAGRGAPLVGVAVVDASSS